tara:strand:+ start:1191 stop:1427 length:237 start_codon:yes stop_codon:yes gene_type:complete
MKVGDLVRHHSAARNTHAVEPLGLVVDIVQKKVWRTNLQGKRVNWAKVDPEPHAVVLYSQHGALSVPVIELEVCNESG